ncbi:dTDP-4-dehydrorhamnose 3,5-epimerase [Qipengyuania spongiae]|uniref:dTDP-4-dehydrorhamnose 3,5-epimerase n=1 Tax=Qipengyuania spongiae TaxID=2909673 RepID=A0ABY5T256_9SPHN|nr:dTDP-4-dehydrorhamnose 3,5-epimerase [Qipengyuania spongiae]UVI40858.1 dTDP-4-dehydrorhamnose 3,5-epimerase [Qipengyuania spongiae]
MEFCDFGIAGAFVIRPRVLADARGSFVKTFHAPDFAKHGLRTDWQEEFYSVSRRGVIRGLHFQTPPAAHAKLVTCLAGEVIDVAVDLRRGSPTEGQVCSVTLNEQDGLVLYLPGGIAHGFQSLSETSTMLYKVTSAHAPQSDAGIAFDSISFAWPVADPIVSDRDRGHPTLADFASPFTFDAAEPSS